MALKSTVDTLDGIPEALHSYYTESGGKFVLAVEGMVAKARVDEFRDTSTSLRRQMDEMTAKFDGIDPERFRELSVQADKVRDKRLLDAGKVDEIIAERVNAMKADHERTIGGLNTDRARMQAQLEGLVIDTAIRDAASKAGVRATAVDDVLLRGRSLFRLQDGKAVPMEGDKPVYGKDGETMGIGEWVGTLTDRAPHLFEQSSGGGSAGKPAGVSHGTIVDRNDKTAFLANLDSIVSGKMTVR